MDELKDKPEEQVDGIAMEILREQKRTLTFMRILVVVLVALLAITNIYHIWQWSQFDTVVVDSGDGGNANYVGGENTGGIFNGADSGAEAEEGQQA